MTMRLHSARAAILQLSLLILLGYGQAAAQEQKAAPIYNAPGGEASAPLFLNQKTAPQASGLIGGILPSQKSYGMKSANIASSPENVARAAQQHQERVARQEAQNKQIRDSQLARIRSEFEAQLARDEAADAVRQQQEAAMRQQQEAAKAGVVMPGASAVPASSPSPYAGSNVVFTGKKDEEKKPVRLFNVQ